MLAQTSLLSYQSLTKKELGDRQQQVFDAIERNGSMSNEEISLFLGLPIQSVTGRVNELARYGYLVVAGLTTTRSGRSAKLWAVADPDDKKLRERDFEG